MEIISVSSIKPIDLVSTYSKINPISEVNLIHVRIKKDDIDITAKEMIVSISDKSWINTLTGFHKSSFLSRAEPTIKDLVDNILSKVTWNSINADFWEYLISYTAQESLEKNYHHDIIPLAELWNKKRSWNPWFDFHTETKTEYLAFWEAKYSWKTTPYKKALDQINDFIGLKKDEMDFIELEHLVKNKNTLKNADENKLKVYVAAFSINKDCESTFNSILNSNLIDPLLIYPELYIIWIEVSH